MRIGVVKEIKPAELRVALTPAGTEELVAAGHTVLVEQSAGEGSGFPDHAYVKAGATIVDDVDKVWEDVDILVIGGGGAGSGSVCRGSGPVNSTATPITSVPYFASPTPRPRRSTTVEASSDLIAPSLSSGPVIHCDVSS